MRLRFLLLVPLVLAACAQGPADGVCILVNGESPVSVAIGEAYAQARGVSRDRIVQLAIPLADPSLGDDRHESIDREGFERLIRQPLERIFQERGWVDAVEIIVTTKGIPLRVEGPAVPTRYLLRESTSASVDAELSLLFSSLIGSPGISSSANPYFGKNLSFREFRDRHPQAALRYLVARLTGYQTPAEPGGAMPRDVARLIERARADQDERALWLVDLDPDLPGSLEIANQVLLAGTIGSLESLGVHAVLGTGGDRTPLSRRSSCTASVVMNVPATRPNP